MFVRPEQIKELISRNPDIFKARVEIKLVDNQDDLTLKLEVSKGNKIDYSPLVRDIINLRANIIKVAPNSLPSDGIIIDDKR